MQPEEEGKERTKKRRNEKGKGPDDAVLLLHAVRRGKMSKIC
jgi:hypothetical protein